MFVCSKRGSYLLGIYLRVKQDLLQQAIQSQGSPFAKKYEYNPQEFRNERFCLGVKCFNFEHMCHFVGNRVVKIYAQDSKPVK